MSSQIATEQLSGSTVLLLQVPRTNDKKELAAEQMLASLHGLLYRREGGLLSRSDRRHIGLEIAVQDRQIGFYVWIPRDLTTYVEEQIYAQYPSVQISEVADYAREPHNYATALCAELTLTADECLPIKTFPSFEVDPLAAITASLAQLEDHEELWLQMLVRPAVNGWHKKSEKYIGKIKGRTASLGVGAGLSVLWAPPGEKTTTSATPSEHDSAKASAAELKSQKLVYETAIRLIYRGNAAPHGADMKLKGVVSSFKQFQATYLNGFKMGSTSADLKHIEAYKNRDFPKKCFVLNIEEVASIYHLPHTNVETPSIRWANTKTAEPPANLPIVFEDSTEVSPIAVTNFRGTNTMFGLPRYDRSRHVYILGQTGTGKSGMLELITISDMYSPYGFAVIDPHGDFAVHTMQRIPKSRLEDVVYFNPADREFPIGFNPLEVVDPNFKNHISSELVGVLKRMFAESWGPRLEYILRYSILALLDYPEATMLDIVRILTDKPFRKDVETHITDSVVRNFWTVEFASWDAKFAAEAVAPILNKVGAFTANPVVRNVIGQPKSSFNLRKMMDEGKIFIVNLSKGLLGEDNAAILGALLVTKVQLAAMSRADIANVDDRKPFYLYVDEFQNFATDSFATILSEARKYGLNLTVANQYTAQMQDTVRDAVFGNVGTTIALRMGADDAKTMVRYFEPVFVDQDLIHMNNRHFVISMSINGEKAQAFSGYELTLPDINAQNDFSAAIIERSRALHAADRQAVEAYIEARYMSKDNKKQPTANNQQPTVAPSSRPVGVASPAKNPPHVPLTSVISPPSSSAPATTAIGEAPAKRKRTRRGRKKKANLESVSESQASQQSESALRQPQDKPTKPSSKDASAAKPADDGQFLLKLR